MIEYLEGLLEEVGQETKVLALAEEMLKGPANTPKQILAIQTAVLRARATSRQYDLAIPPGKAALDLSRQLEEWDYFGTVCLFLGTAHGYVGKYVDACHYLQQYLNQIPLFDKAAKYQSNVWLNIGMFQQRIGNGLEASKAFVMSAKTSSIMKNDRYEHGVRQVLVGQLLNSGDFDQVPRLMVACGQYLRNNDGPGNKSSRLFHTESRVRFAWSTMRRDRARAIAGRGFAEANGHYLRLGELHLLYAQMASESGNEAEALEHAVTARNYARRVKLSTLENEASKFLYDTFLVDQEPGES